MRGREENAPSLHHQLEHYRFIPALEQNQVKPWGYALGEVNRFLVAESGLDGLFAILGADPHNRAKKGIRHAYPAPAVIQEFSFQTAP